MGKKYCGHCGHIVKIAVPYVLNRKGNKIMPYKKYGVGKGVFSSLYMHKEAAEKLGLLKGIPNIPSEFNVVRLFDKEAGLHTKVEFIASPDFDTASEPTTGERLTYDKQKQKYTKRVPAPPNPGLIFHKWLFVNSDYKGFDYNQAMQRSRQILKHDFQPSKIQNKDDWEKWRKQYNV
jgi:hypothetical protein